LPLSPELLYHPETYSAGASGASSDCLALFSYLDSNTQYRSSRRFQKAVGKGVFPVIAIIWVIGYTIPGIDNSAHISGLIAGALLAAVIPYQHPGSTNRPNFFKFIQAVLVTCLFF